VAMVYIAHGVTDQVEGPFGQGKKKWSNVFNILC